MIASLLHINPFLAQEELSPPTFFMPEGASTFAENVDQMFDFINILCLFFFVVIVGVMLYFMWKYRRTEHAANVEGPTHHTVLEVTWSIIPLILVLAMFYYGFTGYMNIFTAPQDAYRINATAWQWGWEFQYPNGATSEHLYVPAGRPVQMVMRSKDVIHDLFIREFRVKQDIVPGRYNYLWFQTDHPTGPLKFRETDDGKQVINMSEQPYYHLFCAEYCGTGHSDMMRRVYVLSEADFEKFLDEQARWLEKIPVEQRWFRAGPRLYNGKGCVQCHALDEGSAGDIGPSWKGLWERTVNGETQFEDGRTLGEIMGSGQEYQGPEDYLRTSILNPQAELVETYGPAMPTFQGSISEAELATIIDFIRHLDEAEFDDEGNIIPPEGAGAEEDTEDQDNTDQKEETEDGGEEES